MLAGRTAPLPRRSILTALLAAGASLALAAPASAQFAFGSFATTGDARAGWVTEPNSAPGSTDNQSIGLFVNGTAADDFGDAALVSFTGASGPPPATPPSFDFKVFTVGGSGGSVRLVVRFSDGGDAALRPVSLQAGVWTHVDGANPDWDNRGGACADLTSQTYAQVLACHPGAEITAVEVVNDSGWLYLGGFQVLVDNVSFAGETVSAPPPPVLGESVGLSAVSGQVVVRFTGGDVARLRGQSSLPVGSVVDSRKGRVRLVSSRGKKRRQAAFFRDGTFRVKQSKKGGGLTDIILRDGLRGCASTSAAASDGSAQASRRRRSRRLWGSGSGSYRTRGLYSSGSVRGTKWLTVDTCEGTRTTVVEGVVSVKDFTTGQTVNVSAGNSYFASRN